MPAVIMNQYKKRSTLTLQRKSRRVAVINGCGRNELCITKIPGSEKIGNTREVKFKRYSNHVGFFKT